MISFFVTDLGSLYETDKVDIIIPGLLLGQELSSGCLIEGGIKGQFLVPEGEYFLCSGTKDLAKGVSYTIVRYKDSFFDSKTGDVQSHLYQYIAQVKLVHILEGGEKMIALVQESFQGVEKGDILIPYKNMNWK